MNRYIAIFSLVIICLSSCQNQELKSKIEHFNSSMSDIENRAKDVKKLNEGELTDFQKICNNSFAEIQEINAKIDDPDLKSRNDQSLARISETLKKIENRLYYYQTFKSTENEILRSLEGEWWFKSPKIEAEMRLQASAKYRSFKINGNTITFHEGELPDIVGKIQLDTETFYCHVYGGNEDEKNDNTKKGFAQYLMGFQNCEACNDAIGDHTRLHVCYKDGKLISLTVCSMEMCRTGVLHGELYLLDARY